MLSILAIVLVMNKKGSGVDLTFPVALLFLM
jgi:hypothetical protein